MNWIRGSVLNIFKGILTRTLKVFKLEGFKHMALRLDHRLTGKGYEKANNYQYKSLLRKKKRRDYIRFYRALNGIPNIVLK